MFKMIFWARTAVADYRANALQAKSRPFALWLYSASHQKFILKTVTPLIEAYPLGSTWDRTEPPHFSTEASSHDSCPLGRPRIQTCYHRRILKARNSRASVPCSISIIIKTQEQGPTPQLACTGSWKPLSSCFGWYSPLIPLEFPRRCSRFAAEWAWAACLYSA